MIRLILARWCIGQHPVHGGRKHLSGQQVKVMTVDMDYDEALLQP
jgi:hypothetical protein